MTSDEDRVLFDVLYELRHEHRDLRFGQMICTLAGRLRSSLRDLKTKVTLGLLARSRVEDVSWTG